MLGMYNLLPLLKGWQYKDHHIERTVSRGAESEPLRISETGWLTGVFQTTTDAYGVVKVEYEDADLQTHTVESYPEQYRLTGAFSQDPAGWIQRYFRPDPNSSAGLYLAALFSGGFQGAIFPYVPTTIITLGLRAESTQQQAIVFAGASTIAITNKHLFIQSLRQVLDSQANIEIAKELLSVGPMALTQQKNEINELLNAILVELKQRK